MGEKGGDAHPQKAPMKRPRLGGLTRTLAAFKGNEWRQLLPCYLFMCLVLIKWTFTINPTLANENEWRLVFFGNYLPILQLFYLEDTHFSKYYPRL